MSLLDVLILLNFNPVTLSGDHIDSVDVTLKDPWFTVCVCFEWGHCNVVWMGVFVVTDCLVPMQTRINIGHTLPPDISVIGYVFCCVVHYYILLRKTNPCHRHPTQLNYMIYIIIYDLCHSKVFVVQLPCRMIHLGASLVETKLVNSAHPL